MASDDEPDPHMRRLLGEGRAALAESRRQLARLAAERRGQFRAPMPTPLMFDDETTNVERISELKLMAAEIAEQMPRPLVVAEVHTPRSSAPPSSRSRRANWLFGLAAVLSAAGGTAGIRACASDAAQAVPHRAPPVASTHP